MMRLEGTFSFNYSFDNSGTKMTERSERIILQMAVMTTTVYTQTWLW